MFARCVCSRARSHCAHSCICLLCLLALELWRLKCTTHIDTGGVLVILCSSTFGILWLVFDVSEINDVNGVLEPTAKCMPSKNMCYY